MLPSVHLVHVVACAVAFSFASGIVPRGVAENPKICTAAETRRARHQASHLEDWPRVYGSFKRFGQCDHAQVAEEYSYVVGRLLAYDWEHIEELLHLAGEDQEFKRFVLRHIDENIPEDEAQRIIRNAQHRCPSDGDWLCKSIVDY